MSKQVTCVLMYAYDMYTYMSMYIYYCVFIYVYISVYVYVYVHVYAHVHLFVFVYPYINVYVDISSYIHACVLWCLSIQMSLIPSAGQAQIRALLVHTLSLKAVFGYLLFAAYCPRRDSLRACTL